MPKVSDNQAFEAVMLQDGFQVDAMNANIVINRTFRPLNEAHELYLNPFGTMPLARTGSFEVNYRHAKPVALKPGQPCSFNPSGFFDGRTVSITPALMEYKDEVCIADFLSGAFTNMVKYTQNGDAVAAAEIAQLLTEQVYDSLALSLRAQLADGGRFAGVTPTWSESNATYRTRWLAANSVGGTVGWLALLAAQAGTFANFNISGIIVSGDIVNNQFVAANVLTKMRALRNSATTPMRLKSSVSMGRSYDVNGGMKQGTVYIVDKWTYEALVSAYNTQGSSPLMQDAPLNKEKVVFNNGIFDLYTVDSIPVFCDMYLGEFEDSTNKRTFSITLTAIQNIAFGVSTDVSLYRNGAVASVPFRMQQGAGLSKEHLMEIKSYVLTAAHISNPDLIASTQYQHTIV